MKLEGFTKAITNLFGIVWLATKRTIGILISKKFRSAIMIIVGNIQKLGFDKIFFGTFIVAIILLVGFALLFLA